MGYYYDIIKFSSVFSLQVQIPSLPVQQQEAGLQQLWRTLPCSRGSGLRWPLCWKSSYIVISQFFFCPGFPADHPPMRVGIALSAAALEDGVRPLHC